MKELKRDCTCLLAAGRLVKYYDRIQEIEVVFDAGKGGVAVEMLVHAEHRNMFVARDDGPDAYACVDACMDKLERQLTEYKTRIRNRKHSGVGRQAAASPTKEQEENEVQ
jgi:ribosomal subunit interface protein